MRINLRPVVAVKNLLYMVCLPPAKKILNIGADDGSFMEQYPYLENMDILINIDKEDVEGCANKNKRDEMAQKYNANIKNMFCNVIDMSVFEDDMFDLIIFNHVIEHLTDEEVVKAFKEIKRVLKPDGCLQLGTPNKKVRIAVGAYKRNKYHIEEYTYQEIKKLLKDNNFYIFQEKGLCYYSADKQVTISDCLNKDGYDPENSLAMFFLAQNKK